MKLIFVWSFAEKATIDPIEKFLNSMKSQTTFAVLK
jgi:hypothetical protein